MNKKAAKHKYVYPVKGGYLVRFIRAKIYEQVFVSENEPRPILLAIGIRDALLKAHGLKLNPS